MKITITSIERHGSHWIAEPWIDTRDGGTATTEETPTQVFDLQGLHCACPVVEHRTDYHEVLGSNTGGAASELLQFRLPHLEVSFEEILKTVCPFLSGVYARGSKVSNTWGNE